MGRASQFLVSRLTPGAILFWGLLTASAPLRADEIQPPERISFTKPQYPERLRKSRIEGGCMLEMLVSEQGRVVKVRPVKVSPGGSGFIEAAVEAVCRWRYRPATQNGRPIHVYLTAVIQFNMDDQQSAEEELTDPVTAADAESRDCPALAGDGAAAPAPPSTVRDAGPAAIDLRAGGPLPLRLGASLEEAEAVLSGATRTVTPEGDTVLTSHELGMEVTLSSSDAGALAVRSIRYVFEDRRDGFKACPHRTAAGLGKGKLCFGIAPAYGAPAHRQDTAGAGGRLITTLDYDLGESRAVFTCVDRWLAELLVEAVAEPAGAK